jgi:glyoxylate reductase
MGGRTVSDVHVLVTRRIPEPGLQALRDAGLRHVIAQEDEEVTVDRAALLEGVRSCDVLLSLLTERVDRELLEANPKLLGVAQMAVGFDNVDVAVATEMGIPVSNTPEVLTETTADLTWALILAAARRLPHAHNYMVAGRYKLWGPSLFLGGDVGPGPAGVRKTLGIVGFGRIGVAVARRATGFDMRVLAFDPYAREAIEASDLAEWAELDDLLAGSDFVSLHSLLTAETRHLIDEDRLRAMKPTAYLINAARGPILDEEALVRALKDGWIAGAGLDVYEREPLMTPGLAELDNVVLLPHIASASVDTRAKMASMAAENAIAFSRRERARNPVNPEVYDSAAYRSRVAASQYN